MIIYNVIPDERSSLGVGDSKSVDFAKPDAFLFRVKLLPYPVFLKLTVVVINLPIFVQISWYSELTHSCSSKLNTCM